MIFKGIIPTNGDFRSRREGSWAGDKWGARDAMGNSFLLSVIARLTTRLDYEHTPSYHPTTMKVNR